MRLRVVDGVGEVLRETSLKESNWVWLSPSGNVLLRWDTGSQTLVLEESISGKRVWLLGDVTPPIAAEVTYIDPILQAGYMLLWNAESGIAEEIDIQGKHSWRIRGLRWRGGPASPLIASPSGRWLAANVSQGVCELPIDIEVIEKSHTGIVDAASAINDAVALIRVPRNPSDPELPSQPALVWQRTIKTTRPAFQLVRKGIGGGSVISMDLFERPRETGTSPMLAILTNAGVTTLYFDARGWVEQEVLWHVRDVSRLSHCWLLPSEYLMIERPPREDKPQALQIIDEAGTVYWEFEPEEEILSVGFDPDRRYMLVEMPREVRAYRLK
jgi:hypothetical protein